MKIAKKISLVNINKSVKDKGELHKGKISSRSVLVARSRLLFSGVLPVEPKSTEGVSSTTSTKYPKINNKVADRTTEPKGENKNTIQMPTSSPRDSSFLFAASTILTKKLPVAVKQWANSVYSFNKNYTKPLPTVDSIVRKIIRSYFSSTPIANNPGGRKAKLSERRVKRLSLNRIFISQPEIKHSNDKVFITVYLFNKKKKSLVGKLKDLYEDIVYSVHSPSKHPVGSTLDVNEDASETSEGDSALGSTNHRSTYERRREDTSDGEKDTYPSKNKRSRRAEEGKRLASKRQPYGVYNTKRAREVKKKNSYNAVRRVALLTKSSPSQPSPKKKVANKKRVGPLPVVHQGKKHVKANQEKGSVLGNSLATRRASPSTTLARNTGKRSLFTLSVGKRYSSLPTPLVPVHTANKRKETLVKVGSKGAIPPFSFSKSSASPSLRALSKGGAYLLKGKAVDNFVTLSTTRNLLAKQGSTPLTYEEWLSLLHKGGGVTTDKAQGFPSPTGAFGFTQTADLYSSLPRPSIKTLPLHWTNLAVTCYKILKKPFTIKLSSKKRRVGTTKESSFRAKRFSPALYKRYSAKAKGIQTVATACSLFLSFYNKNRQKRVSLPYKKRRLWLSKVKGREVSRTYLKRAMTNLLLLKRITKIDTFFSSYKNVLVNEKQGNDTSLYDLYNKEKGTFSSATRSEKSIASIYKVNYIKEILSTEVLYIYYIKMLSFTTTLFKNWFLLSLTTILSKIYNKKVILNLVNLKYIHLNSDIFTQAIAIRLRNSKKNRVNKVLRKALKLIVMSRLNVFSYDVHSDPYKFIEQFYTTFRDLPFDVFNDLVPSPFGSYSEGCHSSRLVKSAERGAMTSPSPLGLLQKENLGSLTFENKSAVPTYSTKTIKGLSSVQSTTISFIRHKSVFGVRLEAGGRLTKRSTASRAIFKIRCKGTLRDNEILNRYKSPTLGKYNRLANLQFTKISSKTRNGSFGLKGWLNNN